MDVSAALAALDEVDAATSKARAAVTVLAGTDVAPAPAPVVEAPVVAATPVVEAPAYNPGSAEDVIPTPEATAPVDPTQPA